MSPPASGPYSGFRASSITLSQSLTGHSLLDLPIPGAHCLPELQHRVSVSKGRGNYSVCRDHCLIPSLPQHIPYIVVALLEPGSANELLALFLWRMYWWSSGSWFIIWSGRSISLTYPIPWSPSMQSICPRIHMYLTCDCSAINMNVKGAGYR